LIDGNGGEFSIKNIGIAPISNIDAVPPANLSVAGRSYQFMDTNGTNTIHGGGYSKGAAVSVASGEVVLYSSGYSSYSTFHASRPRPDGNLAGAAFVIHGTDGRDIISGGSLGDTIYGNGGNDEIYAMGGADSVYAGDGDDVVFVKASSLTEDLVIDGGDGSDTLSFDRVINLDYAGGYPAASSVTVDMESLGAAVSFENIVGGIGNDTISGDSENNVLIGLSGSDVIDGRGGDDTLYGDWQLGEWGQQASGYGIGETWSFPEHTPAGNDILRGGAGSDSIYGNGGNDVLDGGLGADRLTGGSGTDTFVLRIGDGGLTAADADEILDFQNNTDVLGLADGLLYSDIVISQGDGIDVDVTSTVIMTTNGEYLAVLLNTNATDIGITDFSAL
jgi:Ca2+-binding RTX toxin-like protein